MLVYGLLIQVKHAQFAACLWSTSAQLCKLALAWALTTLHFVFVKIWQSDMQTNNTGKQHPSQHTQRLHDFSSMQ